MIRELYHTQEKRKVNLTEPIICKKSNAWLSDGYYFWYDMHDAKSWGNDFKDATGAYQIYKAQIDCENVLDTVFNEEHYRHWIENIEKIAQKIYLMTGKKATLKLLNQYLKEKSYFEAVDGIMFQDLPTSKDSTRVENFFYRKRIQLVVYNIKIINTFALASECIVKKK